MSIFAHERDSTMTYMLGRALADTVLAGPGLVMRQTRWERIMARPVFGQLVAVERIQGASAAAVQHAMERRQINQAVIVPWGNDSGCGTYYWIFGARWLTADSVGFLTARLRPESLWVSGQPTFDAIHAGLYSYAYGRYIAGPQRPRGDAAPPLSPAQVFDLYMALPVAGVRDSMSRPRLREWLRANPTAHTRYPANLILSGRVLPRG
jgi:hypothetical protein